MTQAKEELTRLRKELSAIYLEVSDSYKRMSKTDDNFVFGIHESSIEDKVAKAKKVRDRMDVLRKEVLKECEDIKNSSPINFKQ